MFSNSREFSAGCHGNQPVNALLPSRPRVWIELSLPETGQSGDFSSNFGVSIIIFRCDTCASKQADGNMNVVTNVNVEESLMTKYH